MNLTWKTLCNVIPAFPQIDELILCKNNLLDTDNIKLRDTDLRNLVFLNLEQIQLKNFESIKAFGDLPKLEKIILNNNFLKSLGKISNFKSIKHVSLEANFIETPQIFTELSQFPEMVYLNIKHNPISDKLGRSYVR